MKLFYSAIFRPDVEHGNCYVYFPDLDYSCCLETSDMDSFRQRLEDELGFAMWLFEDSGKVIPAPSTISGEDLPPEAYIDFVPCDYENFRQGVSVKNIDLSA